MTRFERVRFVVPDLQSGAFSQALPHLQILHTNKNPGAFGRLRGSVENPTCIEPYLRFRWVGSLASYLPHSHTPASKIILCLLGNLLIDVMCVHFGVLRCLDSIKAKLSISVNPLNELFSLFRKKVF